MLLSDGKLTLASQGALGGLGLDLLGHVAVESVYIVDTGNEGSNGVLGILAGLSFLQRGDAVHVVVAGSACNRARSALVTEVLLPWGLRIDDGDVSGGHDDDDGVYTSAGSGVDRVAERGAGQGRKNRGGCFDRLL